METTSARRRELYALLDAHLREVYAAQDASSAWQLQRYAVGHLETAAMRADVLSFLHHWLS